MGTANSLLRWYTPAGTLSRELLVETAVKYMLAGLTSAGQPEVDMPSSVNAQQ